MAQPSLIDVPIKPDEKFTVCGDIHGQFYDLMNIFDKNGLPSTTNPYVSFQFDRKFALYMHLQIVFLNNSYSSSMEIS